MNILVPGDVKQLLVWIQQNLLKERPELFVQGDFPLHPPPHISTTRQPIGRSGCVGLHREV
ncbi:hypothetical protein F7725_015446 [Dissostichus mawsoni]|uniref:Uncharacterized protein n=1 Tax=Dissostichus mawsoni TaxID=36200 RepID=A0A7J5YJK7_DISMA|nr:hypothetical protein F7725_015446 [Dissostichus mawsoni]